MTQLMNISALELELEKEPSLGLDYVEKNKQFITASKIKAFEQDPYSYKLKYIDLVPDPTEEPDYFIVGQAFDDMLTSPDEFEAKYSVVSRRMGKSDKIELTTTQNKTLQAMANEFFAQKMFKQKPKKKVFVLEYKGFLLKAELDDYDKENRTIRDVKTISSVHRIEPEAYLLQACFYEWLAEERTGQRHDVVFQYVDKSPIPRSHAVHYQKITLASYRQHMWRRLDELIEAHEMDLFIPTTNQKALFDSPYYGYEGYGRPSQPITY